MIIIVNWQFDVFHEDSQIASGIKKKKNRSTCQYSLIDEANMKCQQSTCNIKLNSEAYFKKLHN